MTGRPPFRPTDRQRQTVQVMRANGDAVSLIARNIGISEHTLRKCFKAELADGLAQVRAAIAGSIVKAALNGNVHAAKYWLSTHGGPEWRVVEGRQIGGLPGAEPIPISAEGRVVSTCRTTAGTRRKADRGDRYGERVDIVTAPDWTGPAYGTCRNAGRVAARWDHLSRRHDRLS